MTAKKENKIESPMFGDVQILDTSANDVLANLIPSDPENKSNEPPKDNISINTDNIELLNMDEVFKQIDSKPDDSGGSPKDNKDNEEPSNQQNTNVDEGDYSPFTLIAQAYLKDNGLDDVDFKPVEFEAKVKELGGSKAMFELIRSEIDLGVEEYKNSLPVEAKEYLTAIEQGVNPAEFRQAQSKSIEYAKLSSEQIKKDEKLQTRLYAETLALRGYSEEEIDAEIEDAKSLGKLEDKSIKSWNALKDFAKKREDHIKEQTKKQQDLLEKQRADYIDNLKKTLNDKQEIIPGVQLTTKLREKIHQSMTTPAMEHPQTGQPMDIIQKLMLDHPQEMRMMLHTLYNVGAFNFDSKGNFKPDFSAISKSAVTKTVTDLEKEIEKSHAKYSKSQRPNIDKGSQTAKDALDAMKIFKNLPI